MGEGQSKAHWQLDSEAPRCNDCGVEFSLSVRRHHCRNCGYIFCANCCSQECPIPMRGFDKPVRVCRSCYTALTSAAGKGRKKVTRQDTTRPSAAATAAATEVSAAAAANAAVVEQQHQALYDDLYNSPQLDTTTAATNAASWQTALSTSDAAAVESGEGAGGAALSGQPLHGAGEEEEVPPEVAERARLAERWAAVRQEALFVDILVQRVERVEPDSTVEYSREAENITLQPEMSTTALAQQLLPLPAPGEGSSAWLLQPPAAIDGLLATQPTSAHTSDPTGSENGGQAALREAATAVLRQLVFDSAADTSSVTLVACAAQYEGL